MAPRSNRCRQPSGFAEFASRADALVGSATQRELRGGPVSPGAAPADGTVPSSTCWLVQQLGALGRSGVALASCNRPSFRGNACARSAAKRSQHRCRSCELAQRKSPATAAEVAAGSIRDRSGFRLKQSSRPQRSIMRRWVNAISRALPAADMHRVWYPLREVHFCYRPQREFHVRLKLVIFVILVCGLWR